MYVHTLRVTVCKVQVKNLRAIFDADLSFKKHFCVSTDVVSLFAARLVFLGQIFLYTPHLAGRGIPPLLL